MQKRNYGIDFVRGIGILLMILGHLYPPTYVKLIYSFHMPLFFIISGYLYNAGSKRGEGYIRKQFHRLIVPYLVFSAFNILFAIFEGLMKNQLDGNQIRIWLRGVGTAVNRYGWMGKWVQLWFLPAMFIASVIFHMISNIKNVALRYGVLGLCPLVSYALYLFQAPKLIWNIDSALMAVLFMYFGKMLRDHQAVSRICEWSERNLLLLTGFMLSVGVFCGFINVAPFGSVFFDANSYGNFGLMAASGMLIPLAMLILSNKYINEISMKNIFVRYIVWMGKHTMVVLGFDIAVGTLAAFLVSKMGMPANCFYIFVVKVILHSYAIFVWNFVVGHIKNGYVKKYLSF